MTRKCGPITQVGRQTSRSRAGPTRWRAAGQGRPSAHAGIPAIGVPDPLEDHLARMPRSPIVPGAVFQIPRFSWSKGGSSIFGSGYNHLDTGALGDPRGVLVIDADLRPQHFRADGHSLVGDGRKLLDLRNTSTISTCRQSPAATDDLQAADLLKAGARIDRDHVIAGFRRRSTP